MHVFTRPLIAALVAGSAIACSSGKTITESRVVIPNGSAAATLSASAIMESGDRRWPEDPIEVVESAVRGDSLHLTVRYGGGCAEHRIALVLSSVWMRSNPLQIAAWLSHDAGGDRCEALIEKRIAFSLQPLRDEYRRRLGKDTGTVVFTLRQAPTTHLSYSF